jgi:hypothetical protein
MALVNAKIVHAATGPNLSDFALAGQIGTGIDLIF